MEYKDITTLLENLRDDPVDNTDVTDQILGRVYNHLLAVSKDKNGKLHWFCQRASSTTIGAASFLLRLFAYDGSEAETWRGHLNTCFVGCCDCIVEFEKVKGTSRMTYFAKFSSAIMDNFWMTFDSWDVEQMLKSLERFGITSANSNPMVQTLSDIPSPIVLRMMSNWAIFSEPRIQSIIRSIPPRTVFQDWPTASIPPGVLVLLVEQTSVLRQWASSQMSHYPSGPTAVDNFSESHMKALEALVLGLTSRDSSGPSSGPFSFLHFAQDISEIWADLNSALRFVPVEYLKRNSRCKVDIRKLVSRHLSDTEIHFVEILRCFNFLLKRLEASFWESEPSEYPLTVFDVIKNNSAFGELLLNPDSSGSAKEKSWYLSWIFEYFHSVQKMEAIYETVVAKISDFLLEELQHERFGDARTHILESAARFLSSILAKANGQFDAKAKKALLTVMDIHANTLTRITFHRDYDKPQWSRARHALRDLLDGVLLSDVQQTSSTITEACRLLRLIALKKPLNQISALSIRTGLWPKVYQSIHRQDPDGFARVLILASELSHIDTLNESTFGPLSSATNIGKAYVNGGAVVTAINSALSTHRAGFLDAVRNFADFSTSSQLSDIFKRLKVGKAVFLLLLSPVDNLHTTAKTLVGQVFDVDGRLECIRALLDNLPDQSIDGLVEFLNRFCAYAPTVPEACSLSKSLVRCFTDVIETLCSGADGLLRRPQFLRCDDSLGPASRMIELWVLMSKVIAVIFKRTPAWSIYFDNEEMVEWMRDALIFGRDMLAQWQVIEGAANAFFRLQQDRSKGKASMAVDSLSETGQKMISCFQDVLTELTRWLRLTDEELLHQSFSLLQSLLDLFHKTGIRPCEAALSKLTKYADSARKDIKQTRSRLDASHIAALEEALAVYNDDDEIKIISEQAFKETYKPTKEKSKQKLSVHESTKRSESSLSMQKEAKAVKLDTLKQKQTKPTIATHPNEKDKAKGDRSMAALSMPRKADSTFASAAEKQVSSQRPKENRGYRNEATTAVASESSSESDGSESDAPAGGLATLAKKFAKSPKIKKPVERKQIKFLETTSMAEDIKMLRFKQREEAQRAQKRMRPDISGLHRTLLSWNYDHDGPMPPGFDTKLTPVPDVFMDLDHFHRIFEPLLMLECWAQIVQAKDDPQETLECKIISKQYVDEWLELDIVYETNVRKDYYLAQETDVVLLRNSHTNESVMAKTKSFTSNYQGIQASLRCYFKDGAGDPGLQISTSWKISKVFSLSTLHREYAALKSLPYYDFVNIILQPRLRDVEISNKQEIRKTMSDFNINEPQAMAILKSMATNGFSLIQGPPGTGKTSTICGLVSLALSKRSRPAVPIQVGNGTSLERPPLSKVLLCAPSNAAIDEIARRIKDGYRGPEKRGEVIKVVRIGTEQSMNASVKDISLDYLVDLAIDPPTDGDSNGEIITIRKELEGIRVKKDQLHRKLEEDPDTTRLGTLQSEIAQLNARRSSLAGCMDRLKDEQKSASRALDALRRSTRQKVLLEADVVCSTLSGAGHELIERLDFDMIIVDESAQAIELSTLIPLKYSCQRCILVGDPQQLPPTVLSQEASKYQYNQSLFVRMQKSQPDAVHLLSIQYRMHPEISQLPSLVFYQGRLKDGPNMAEKTAQPWHKSSHLGTYKFFNVSKGLEETSRHSVKNLAECHVAVALFNRLRLEYGQRLSDIDYRVGVVSMYRAQIAELKRQFEQRFGKEILSRVDFNTVDGFQGQEKDIIILSCVRAGPGLQAIGFLSDVRRMNVALTRAKSSLFILGNATTLERSDLNWRRIVGDARGRSRLVEADHTYFIKPLSMSNNSHGPKSPESILQETPQPLPEFLFKPRELKDAQPSKSSSSIKPPANSPSASNDANNEPQKLQVIGVKRPAEESVPTKQENAKRPALPPIKRPKKAPNIFIPKKKT